MNIKTSLALLLSLSIFFPALGQNRPTPQPQPQQTADDKDDVVRITTNLVQVDVVVTKDGKLVPNLTADDFEIFEDGRRQTITSFAYVSNVPTPALQPPANTEKKSKGVVVPYSSPKPNEARRIMAFVVDDLGISAESLDRVRGQLRKFVNEQMQPNDLIAILRTGGELGALQQFTNDKRLLIRAVDRLRWNSCSRVGLDIFPPAGSSGFSGICGYRSIYATLQSLRFIIDSMGYLPGRKSLVLLSDSLPIESQDEGLSGSELLREAGILKDEFSTISRETTNLSGSLRTIAEKAIRSSVVIYSVDTQGLVYTGFTAADPSMGDPGQMLRVMSQRSNLLLARREGGELIAAQTGGFQIHNSNSFGFERILQDQSGYYLLGYRPSDETFNLRFHHIKANVKRSGMRLRTRFGFIGATEEEANRVKPIIPDTTNLALASPFGAQDIEVDLTSFFTDAKKTGPVVRSFVYIDPKNLTFTSVNGRHQALLELYGVIFGDNGALVEQLAREAPLDFSDAEFEQIMRYGVGIGFDMPAKRPGDYQVRVAARDKASSKIGSAGQFLLVPDLQKKQLAVSGIVLGTLNPDKTIDNSGGRRFVSNSDLYYAFKLYNATNESGKRRDLVMDVAIFRDGKIVHSVPETPIAASEQSDLNRVYVGGTIRLIPELEPANYYLQIVIRDPDPKKKALSVTQWADFEIEKR